MEPLPTTEVLSSNFSQPRFVLDFDRVAFIVAQLVLASCICCIASVFHLFCAFQLLFVILPNLS